MKFLTYRKKSWRKVILKYPKSNWIRKVCFSILILELAYAARESNIIFLPYSYSHEEFWTEPDLKEADHHKKTYGVQIRLKEGVLDFYQKEEIKNTQ